MAFSVSHAAVFKVLFVRVLCLGHGIVPNKFLAFSGSETDGMGGGFRLEIQGRGFMHCSCADLNSNVTKGGPKHRKQVRRGFIQPVVAGESANYADCPGRKP